MDPRTQLQEILERGGPRQAEMAGELLGRLDALDSPALRDEISTLYDAYLHDPYLTRYDP